LKLTITGDIPSKKNSHRIFFHAGRRIVSPSQKFRDWNKQALSQLTGIKPVDRVTSIELTFYPSTKRKFDLTNKAESIMDLLVDAGIIEDDNYTVIPQIKLQFGNIDKSNPRAEITINT
jgi:Holliday junction resolvase RusA-like endonuclease